MPAAKDSVHTFRTRVRVDRSIEDGYMKHFVLVPKRIAKKLLSGETLPRVVGTLESEDDMLVHPYRRMLHRREDETFCLRFGAGWLSDASLAIGDALRVTIEADPNPDAVDVPEVLARMLREAPELKAAWDAYTPGRQRTLVYGVERAKRAETKLKRAEAICAGLRDPELAPDAKARRRSRQRG